MDEFNTIEKVKELFDKKGCSGKDSIYIVMLKDFRKYSGMVAGAEYPYDGLLLCITEDGIGYFQLKQAKFALVVKMERLTLVKDSYTYIKNEDIKSVELKKFALLDKKRKELIIKTNDKKTHYLCGFIQDETLPYLNENMAKLIEKYSAK